MPRFDSYQSGSADLQTNQVHNGRKTTRLIDTHNKASFSTCSAGTAKIGRKVQPLVFPLGPTIPDQRVTRPIVIDFSLVGKYSDEPYGASATSLRRTDHAPSRLNVRVLFFPLSPKD